MPTYWFSYSSFLHRGQAPAESWLLYSFGAMTVELLQALVHLVEHDADLSSFSTASSTKSFTSS